MFLMYLMIWNLSTASGPKYDNITDQRPKQTLVNDDNIVNQLLNDCGNHPIKTIKNSKIKNK